MSLVKEARLRRVGRYYSFQLNAKCEKFEGNIVRIFGVVFSVEDKNVLCNGSCFKEFTAKFNSKKHRLCWSWNAGWVLIGADYSLRSRNVQKRSKFSQKM